VHTLVKKALVGLAVAAALIATPAAASASVVPQPKTMTYECFGYTGTFKYGTIILKPDWDRATSGPTKGPDECFGVAPNGVVYHAWRNHPWIPMPYHNVLADNMAGWDVQLIGGIREVYMQSAGAYYHAQLNPTWGTWQQCDLLGC
jgi:hypothetical protein